MIAEHDGAGEYQSARTSQLCGAPVSLLTIGCEGANVTHQPSWTKVTAIAAFHASSAMMQVLANRVLRNGRCIQRRAGNATPSRMASAVPSSGKPSSVPLIRAGHSSATAAASPQTAQEAENGDGRVVEVDKDSLQYPGTLTREEFAFTDLHTRPCFV
jgi:hypothetical protein